MPVIEVSGLRKQYGSKVAVEDVSFTVEAGEIFGILGPNGAGKTTTVECVTGLRTPDRGVLRVLGLDPRRNHDELDELVGVQLQDSQLPDKIRVSEALDLYASFYRRPARSGELLTRLGLADQRNAFFSKLSGGQKQPLSVALALIGTPKVAVLGGEQHIRFQPSAPLNESVLTTLPEVSSVHLYGEQLLVTGNSEALQAVIAVLARQGVIAQHLRVEQATLDDAFVALTGKPAPAGGSKAPSQGCTLNCSARPGKRACLRNGSEWPGRSTTPWPRA
jgi:ABC-type uncharacterized transport system ATPase subunit